MRMDDDMYHAVRTIVDYIKNSAERKKYEVGLGVFDKYVVFVSVPVDVYDFIRWYYARKQGTNFGKIKLYQGVYLMSNFRNETDIVYSYRDMNGNFLREVVDKLIY